MPIPLTQTCPQCEADMELLTADDEGEIVVYECPDCGFQSEERIRDDGEGGQADAAEDAGLDEDTLAEGERDEGESESFEPEDDGS